MKTKYVETNYSEITEPIRSVYRQLSRKQRVTLIPLAAGSSPPRAKKQRDADVVAATPVNTGLVNINTASVEELAALVGIGDDGAKRIIRHRPFAQLNNLMEVGGIGQATYDKVFSQITV